MFYDHAKITLISGKGGNGAVSFRREKFVPNGGPDGGNGGKGGSVIFEAVSAKDSLQDFRFKHKFVAEDGEAGGKYKRNGKDAEDLIIQLPVGTQIFDASGETLLYDMCFEGQKVVIAEGGSGGKGNMNYASSVRQAPKFAQAGFPGEKVTVKLVLKLIADVGLIGMPNVGKSTLISVLSAAKSKIADYAFTTLQPHLGVVARGYESFVMADLPGLIEGAAAGAGLGREFLKHAERARLLYHMIDAAESEGRDAISDYEKITAEIAEYGEGIPEKPVIVVLNKIDAADDNRIKDLKDYFAEKGLDCFAVSAATHEGLDELVHKTFELLREIPDHYDEENFDYSEELQIKAGKVNENLSYTIDSEGVKHYKFDSAPKFKVFTNVYGEVCVGGDWIVHLLHSTNFTDYESALYFQKQLKQKGVNRALKEYGVAEGDTVIIDDVHLEFSDDDFKEDEE